MTDADKSSVDIYDPAALDEVRSAMMADMRLKLDALTGPFAQNQLGNLSMGAVHSEINAGQPAWDALKEAAAWTLVRDGIIVPGRSSNLRGSGTIGFDMFPNYRITPYGKTVLSRPELDPLDKSAFLKHARGRLRNADERVYTYLAEGNKNFVDGSYLSAAVMLGVSAELLMKWLIERFIDHVGQSKRANFEKTRDELWMRTDKLFDSFINAFAAHYKEFPKDLKYQAEANLDLLQTLIRINRDDVGHGRPQRVDREMVHGHLLNYLTLLKLAQELADAFSETCTVYGVPDSP